MLCFSECKYHSKTVAACMSRIFLYIKGILRGLELCNYMACVTSHMAIALFKTWHRPWGTGIERARKG